MAQLVGKWHISGSGAPRATTLNANGTFMTEVFAGGGLWQYGKWSLEASCRLAFHQQTEEYWSENYANTESSNGMRRFRRDTQTVFLITKWRSFRLAARTEQNDAMEDWYSQAGIDELRQAVISESAEAVRAAVSRGAKTTERDTVPDLLKHLILKASRDDAALEAFLTAALQESPEFADQALYDGERRIADGLTDLAFERDDFRLYALVRASSKHPVALTQAEQASRPEPLQSPFAALMCAALDGSALPDADQALTKLSFDALWVLRNAPFARHGRPFRSRALSEYFYGVSTRVFAERSFALESDQTYNDSVLTIVDKQNTKAVMREWEHRRTLKRE